MMRRAIPLWLLLASLLTVSAAERVEFVNGRTLDVERWEADGTWVTLELVGGGVIEVPLTLVRDTRALIDPVEPAVLAPTVSTAPLDATPMSAHWRARAGEWAVLIEEAAVRHGISADLLAAMVEVESNFDRFAISHKGACGLLQLLPETAERFGISLKEIFDPRRNLEGGASYLRWLLDRFDGRTEWALAGYNAGERAVERHGGIPPYRETRNYVRRIMKRIR